MKEKKKIILELMKKALEISIEAKKDSEKLAKIKKLTKF